MGQLVTIEDLRERRQRRINRDSEPLLTKAALADRADVCERTIENWQRRGMPVVRLGPRCVRYRWSDVEAWSTSLS